MSGGCARSRGREWCRGRRLGLTATGGDLDQQWRRGGIQIERPSGGFVRVLGRNECGRRGGFMGVFA
jgi:hypothetical protein